jgi:hypothetical protein
MLLRWGNEERSLLASLVRDDNERQRRIAGGAKRGSGVFFATGSDKSVESACALLFVFSEIRVFPFVLVCRVSFRVFAAVFGTDFSLFRLPEATLAREKLVARIRIAW